MELTIRIFVFLVIIAAGSGVGAALGKASFDSASGGQEAAVTEAQDDDYLPAQYTSTPSQLPYTLEVQLFGECVILN